MGAIHGRGYYDRIGLSEACFSGARGRCRGSDGSAQAASACAGSGVLQRPGGATAGDDRKMNNEPLEREPIDHMRARLEALFKANAAPRCALQAWLGHRNIQHTVRYTELAPDRFKNFWR